MEYWNIYDKDRQLTSLQAKRKEKMKEGCYHLIAHVCIFNSKGEMLIQKRASTKKIWPNMWDVSAGGSVKLHESTREGAQRELLEELGLVCDLSHQRAKLTLNLFDAYDDFFIVEKDYDLNEVQLDLKEVQEVKWASKEEVFQLLKQGQFVDYGILSALFQVKDRWGPEREKKQ